jgi:hypothetical protein
MSDSTSGASPKLKSICNLIMNMDSRVRFAGVLDNEGMLVEGVVSDYRDAESIILQV